MCIKSSIYTHTNHVNRDRYSAGATNLPVTQALGLQLASMKIQIEIGNPTTEEWEFGGEMQLQPFDEVFSRTNPHLPPAPGFSNQLAIEDFETDIHGQSQVTVNAHYDPVQDNTSIFVKHNGQSFVQLTCPATNSGGQGKSLIFNAPGTTVPVSLTCQP